LAGKRFINDHLIAVHGGSFIKIPARGQLHAHRGNKRRIHIFPGHQRVFGNVFSLPGIIVGVVPNLQYRVFAQCSIFYHPCEWVHQQFWDGVNFSRGANPPREAWRPPLQRTTEETEGAFQRFGDYLDHLRALPGVRFVTASDLPAIYPDSVRNEGATREELAEVAQRILKREAPGVDFQSIGGKSFSLADQFELLALAVGEQLDGRKPKFPLVSRGLLGPDNSPPITTKDQRITWPAFRAAARDVRQFVQTQQRVPARIFIGADAVSPADFLTALAFVYDSQARKETVPIADEIPLAANIAVLPAGHVAEDTPNLFGGWVIHKEGFRAPKILEVARLQAWTLKPARRKE